MAVEPNGVSSLPTESQRRPAAAGRTRMTGKRWRRIRRNDHRLYSYNVGVVRASAKPRGSASRTKPPRHARHECTTRSPRHSAPAHAPNRLSQHVPTSTLPSARPPATASACAPVRHATPSRPSPPVAALPHLVTVPGRRRREAPPPPIDTPPGCCLHRSRRNFATPTLVTGGHSVVRLPWIQVRLGLPQIPPLLFPFLPFPASAADNHSRVRLPRIPLFLFPLPLLPGERGAAAGLASGGRAWPRAGGGDGVAASVGWGRLRRAWPRAGRWSAWPRASVTPHRQRWGAASPASCRRRQAKA